MFSNSISSTSALPLLSLSFRSHSAILFSTSSIWELWLFECFYWFLLFINFNLRTIALALRIRRSRSASSISFSANSIFEIAPRTSTSFFLPFSAELPLDPWVQSFQLRITSLALFLFSSFVYFILSSAKSLSFYRKADICYFHCMW